MKTNAIVLATLLTLVIASHSQAAAHSEIFPRSTPEAQGVSSAALLEFVEALDTEVDEMHSVMVVRHGHVIAEGWWAPYAPELNHVLYSLSKSFTSTAVGLAVAEGKLSVDDRVLKFFPDDARDQISENLRQLRVRDLLAMSVGHETEISSAADQISVKAFLAQPIEHEPGTRFKYNTPATFMQSAIVQKLTGETVLEYLGPRLFEPLGIANPVWDANFQGISLGGYGLRVRTEDIARFGQLYLQKGKWRGEQLIPSTWVSQATTKQVSNGSNPNNDWNQGYGFQFWRSRHNAYRGDGAFGQYCIVMEDQDAVLAITSGVGDMQKTMNIAWEKLIPILGDQSLAQNPSANAKLKHKLAGLALRKPEGAASSSVGERISGKLFRFDENDRKVESLSVALTGDTVSIALVRDGETTTYRAGLKDWASGRGPIGPFADEPLAGAAAWSTDDTLAVKIAGVETPYALHLTLKFSRDEVTFDSRLNVAFGPREAPRLVGRIQ